MEVGLGAFNLKGECTMKKPLTGILLGSLLGMGLLAIVPVELAAGTDTGSADRAKGEQAYAAKDYAQAMKWCRKAADQGDAAAQTEVGTLYELGQGVTRDYKNALKWYLKAAIQDNPDAQYHLAQLYEAGKGVKRDYHQALKWFKKAAAQGKSYAEIGMGRLYEDGKGVTRDYQEAMRWYQKAVEHGNQEAKMSIEKLKHKMAK
jgi:TPR repeat protein